MGGKRFTRYFRDPDFRAAVDEQFALADAATEPGVFITYAIHDPTRPDHIGARPDGLILYVGQSKEFSKRIRKRMRNAGTATSRPPDRIDGASYDIMARGGVPRFTVLERVPTAIESLVSETNWTKRLRTQGYPLLNQWTEQKFAGKDIDRHTVPHDWLWPLTAADALGSGIDLIIRDPASGAETMVDLSNIEPATRLRDIRSKVKETGARVRLYVR